MGQRRDMPDRKRRPNNLVSASSLVSEAELQLSFMEVAEALGWNPHHTPDSRRSKGAGFPDLVLRHDEIPPYIAVFELKTMEGRIRKGQPLWIKAFRRAGVPAMIARLPRDWDKAMAILQGDAQAIREARRI